MQRTKKVLSFCAFLAMLAIFYGCAQSGGKSQQTTTITGDPGVLIFPVTSFQPGVCVDVIQQLDLVTASSDVVAGWDRDSLGAASAQIAYLRPSVDVGKGQAFFVLCNSSQNVITIPANSAIMYEIFNGKQ